MTNVYETADDIPKNRLALVRGRHVVLPFGIGIVGIPKEFGCNFRTFTVDTQGVIEC